MPRATVVTPTYRTSPDRLARCLDSVEKQTLLDFEHLLVDDGSGDGAAAAAVARRPKARVISLPENKGRAAARNAGIREARGEFIAFLDADDAWDARMLEHQTAALDDDAGVVLVSTDCRILLPDGAVHPKPFSRYYEPLRAFAPPRGDALAELLVRNPIRTSTMMVRRSFLETTGAFDETLPFAEDWEFCIRLAKAGPFVWIEKPLADYQLNRDAGAWQTDAARRWDVQRRVIECAFEDPSLEARLPTQNLARLRREAQGQALFEIAVALLVRGRGREARPWFARCARATPGRIGAYAGWALGFLPRPAAASVLAWRDGSS